MAAAGGGIGSPNASGPAFGPAAKHPRPPNTVGPPISPPGWLATSGVNPNSPAPYWPAFGPVVSAKLVLYGEKSSSVEMSHLLSLDQYDWWLFPSACVNCGMSGS